MRRSATFSATLGTSFDEAFEFISDPQNLHLWTIDFAIAPPKKSGDVYVVQTARGALDLFVRSNRDNGTIDFHFGRDGKFQSSPSRLLRADDRCVYVFTQFEPHDAPEGLFERLVENVRREMEILESRWAR